MEVKEADTIEFGIESIYKLSTRIKTRYEPHSTFLTFNPNRKGFEIARDPDTEKIKDIQEILRQTQKTPNQTEFRKMIKDELDYSDHEARRLIKKGGGLYWQREEKKKEKDIEHFVMSICQIYIVLTNQHNKLMAYQFLTQQTTRIIWKPLTIFICCHVKNVFNTTTQQKKMKL